MYIKGTMTHGLQFIKSNVHRLNGFQIQIELVDLMIRGALVLTISILVTMSFP